MKYIPDTSVLINNSVTKSIENNKIPNGSDILIPRPVLAELEYQANAGIITAFFALVELEKLKQKSISGLINLEYVGKHPTLDQIKSNQGSAISFELAQSENGILITSNKLQTRLAEIQGIQTLFLEDKKDLAQNRLEKYFTENTMSVHL